MKRILPTLLAVFLMVSLTACGSNASSGTTENTPAESTTSLHADASESTGAEASASAPAEEAVEAEESESAQPEGDTLTTGKDTLVVYFSATGTTKGVAEKIAAITDADLYAITAAQEYTSDDLNWNVSSSRTTKEQDDPSVRPEIESDPLSLERYSTIYIGYPIWWGEEPRILDTFVESYDFDGITMIPFCTSSSSGMGRSGQNLADNAGSGTWLEGERFSAGASEAEIESWIKGIE